MMKTQQAKLKQQIVSLIKGRELPVSTQYLVDHVMLPEQIILNDLLTELVADRRLIRSYTLLVNGEPECTYSLIS